MRSITFRIVLAHDKRERVMPEYRMRRLQAEQRAKAEASLRERFFDALLSEVPSPVSAEPARAAVH